MAKIEAFKAVVYNQEKVKDLSKVVCPPYDVISPAKQGYYHELSPYNLIHILLDKDIPGDDKYRRAAHYFKEWLKDRVLIREDSPAIYFYSQKYKIKGETKTRVGFIALLHLEDKNQSVFKHEYTRIEAKEDRYKLLKQVKANLSPIFAVFPDKKKIVSRVYKQCAESQNPAIEVTDDEKTVHKLWRIDDPQVLDNIRSSMKQEDIFIADGHHRYEVACAFRQEMKEKSGVPITGEESFNYMLCYFTNTDSRGLSILPIHRLLKLGVKLDTDKFKTQLKEYFDVEEVKDKTRFFFLMEKGGQTEHLLGVYKDNKYWLLRLKNVKILDKMISDKPKVYRSLDVCILNTIILNGILGVNVEAKENLTFSPDADEFIRIVDNDPAHVAFFLNPVRIQQIMAVAKEHERMPAKSTYFYPKVLSGLLINKLD